MLRSLLTGVSGAKAHQKRLDVVGNNIANVNTVGFKKSTVVFQDLLSQTERGAMAPDGNVGGVNAKQVGLGVQVGAIETIHTQGTISQTGNRTDMAIQGEGYYVVKNGAENLYTRAGQFVLDSNSDLAMSGTGYRVQGNEMTVDEDGVVSTGSELSDINIPIGRKMEAKATSTVGYRCNLDSRVDPYLPLGIPDGVKFSSEILGSEYTISVAEGEDVSDFINIRLENEADGSVETLRFSFEGVQQSSHDESTYYPKLELVGSSGHTVNYDAAKGELSIDGTSIPMSAYMNYQAVSIEDSTGTTHTYLAEITEIGNKAQVRLWGEGKNESTGASQVDYFQWNVLKTEDGLFDPDSTLKMTTGEDSEFPDPISLFLEIDSSGKALNFRGNVSPIIGPATSNSGVSKAGDTKVNVGINQTYSKTYNHATLDFNYDKTFTGTVNTPAEDYTLNVKTSMPSGPYDVGDIIPLTLETSGVLDGSEKSSVRQTVNIRYAGVNVSGQGVFQYDNAGTWTDLNVAGDIDVGLKGYSVNNGADTWVNNDDYFLAYDEGTGKFTLKPQNGDSRHGDVESLATTIDPIENSKGDHSLGSFSLSVTTDAPSSTYVGQTFNLTLKSEAKYFDSGVAANELKVKTESKDLRLKCVEIDEATGLAVLEWYDTTINTVTGNPGGWKKFTEAAEVTADDPRKMAGIGYFGDSGYAATAGDKYTLNYVNGKFSVEKPTSATIFPDKSMPIDVTVSPFPRAFTSASTDKTVSSDVGYYFKEGDSVDDFMTMVLNYSDAGTLTGGTVPVKLAFKGVSEDGNVILQPSPSTVDLPAADPENADSVILVSHKVVYDPEKGTLSLVNEDTGKTAWNYSDFNFQTTEINGAQYLVDYDSSEDPDSTYGDIVSLWGPDEMGSVSSFKISATTPAPSPAEEGTLGYSNSGGSVVYSGSQTFDSNFAGGAKVTVKPSPTDPSKLIFTYDGTDGGDPVSSIREGSGSVHEGKGTIYDSLGNEHTLEVVWKKVGSNAWSWEAFLPDEPELKLSDNKGVLRFSSEGKLLSGGENTISIGFSAIGADDADVVLDFSGKSFDKEEIEGVTQYGSAFTTKPYTQNGYSMGILEDFSVSNDGTIVGIYDNGQNRGLYKMALAMFANPQGLVKTGNTCFSKSINSGDPSIVNAMVEGAGTIAGSSLEYSNVDITDEFTDLITTQRGFQASARVITTSDSVLEELLNLKR